MAIETLVHDSVHTLYAEQMDTPLGRMRAVAGEDGIVLFDFLDRKDVDTAVAALPSRLGAAGPIVAGADHPRLALLRQQIAEYFAGERVVFSVPLQPRGTGFERRAWEYLRAIPFGETRTYGEQARALGAPGAARAVGRANGVNFIAILIPCHRVIGADGRLTGYGGGMERKRWLLDHERRIAGNSLFARPA